MGIDSRRANQGCAATVTLTRSSTDVGAEFAHCTVAQRYHSFVPVAFGVISSSLRGTRPDFFFFFCELHCIIVEMTSSLAAASEHQSVTPATERLGFAWRDNSSRRAFVSDARKRGLAKYIFN